MKIRLPFHKKKIQNWKEHIKAIIGNPPDVSDEITEESIQQYRDNKFGLFTNDELRRVLREIKSRKAGALVEKLSEVLKTKKCGDIYGKSIDFHRK